jgi:hypothetical protein
MLWRRTVILMVVGLVGASLVIAPLASSQEGTKEESGITQGQTKGKRRARKGKKRARRVRRLEGTGTMKEGPGAEPSR